MSGFSAEWLRLREPFDRAARDAAAGALRLDTLARRCGAAAAEPFTVLDLGCGTGANLRYLAPRLGGTQHWWLVDHDPALLAALPAALADAAAGPGYRFEHRGRGGRWSGPGFSAELELLPLDLSQALGEAPFAKARLVTASALLDLVSASWLGRLAAHCEAAGAALLFALNVDGRIGWTPADADDERVRRLFAAHQRRDKGFGAALGAAAVPLLAQRLAAAGWKVQQAESDWQLPPGEMQAALLAGMAAAAQEQAPGEAAAVADWCRRRRLQPAELRVGHLDLLAER
ncbi:class I SAM-dependent methyltransferase [Eleftheria terrae]|uniref:class I SAM-dependent methyltransferase n=1 Tax=Eleftheria terrae TaxID=1597781 RepID=UPI00263AF35F|nr:class I SAM-dependent methyltransferase [Eleftheria terrae]WKB51854.1 class I SAM-dependent methyltransferase [Eleftheria terrae]